MANPFRTSNPALNEKAFRGEVAVGEAMTLQGTVKQDRRAAAVRGGFLRLGHGAWRTRPLRKPFTRG